MLFFLICLFAICSSQVESNNIKEERTLLNDGNWMPANAFGTYTADLNDRPLVTQAVVWALEAGYRHIDTAALYLSEDLIGEAIQIARKRGIVERKDIFVNTKLSFNVGTRKQVIPRIENSLKRLQLDYVDSCLIHTPRNVLNLKNHDYLEIWKGLEDAKRQGLVRSIGVSNFNATEINRILLNSKTVPAINQIETNPTFTDLELVAYCESQKITVTGYAPFGFLVPRPFNDLSAISPSFRNPILVGLAEEYCVEVSQILLRYLVDRCIVPIAASLDKKHIALNEDIYGFCMRPKDILTINEFDRNVKVYVIDYDGLEEKMREDYYVRQRYIEKNNLKQYKDV